MNEFLEKLPKILLPRDKNIKNVLKAIPKSAGVYIFYGKGTPIYIGKAIDLKRRVSSYFDLDLEPKTDRMVATADTLSFIQVTSELEGLLLEARLIRKFMPQYNIAAKDDKHPLYILITKERYPRILTSRKSEVEKIKSLAVYGPFPSSASVRGVLKWLRKVFPFSEHKIGERPCLYSHIGLCRPCPNVIQKIKDPLTQESEYKKYKSNIRHLKGILDGKIAKVHAGLLREMNNLSDEEHYEEARNIRDQLKTLEYITARQLPVDSFLENPNLYEDLRAAEITSLRNLLEKFGISLKKLERIECFDVAHLVGDSPTASMVTFVKAEPEKKFYRHFKIRQSKSQSDTDSLKEVIRRRINHLKDWGVPDLIVVDGGKPQVSTFVRELEEYKIAVIGIAKRFETLVIPSKNHGTLLLKESRLAKSPALNLIQRMRDEAHRFARRYHHKLLFKKIRNANTS